MGDREREERDKPCDQAAVAAADAAAFLAPIDPSGPRRLAAVASQYASFLAKFDAQADGGGKLAKAQCVGIAAECILEVSASRGMLSRNSDATRIEGWARGGHGASNT